MTNPPTKITFGETRASGVRDVLIYCRDYRCSHIEPRFTCTVCGRRGADIRPSFPKVRMGTG